MKRRKIITGTAAAIGLFCLILDGQTALLGAKDGVTLCILTVIPSLFPFFVMSGLINATLTGTTIPILRPITRLCGIPRGAEAVLISGFLGGYPVGAQAIHSAYCNGWLDKQEAERLLGFCSNAGPAFLFGLLSSFFPERWMVPAIWVIQILSALLVGMLTRGRESRNVTMKAEKNASLSDCIKTSVKVMASVCGWVVLFRVLIAFLSRWFFWFMPVNVQVAIAGILELTNGCCALNSIAQIPTRFWLCSGMLSLGGLCVAMQTRSVTEGLSLKWYYRGKLLQCLISILLSMALFYRIWYLFVILAAIITVFWIINKKSSSNCAVIGV